MLAGFSRCDQNLCAANWGLNDALRLDLADAASRAALR
jgi:hypothetical protein